MLGDPAIELGLPQGFTGTGPRLTTDTASLTSFYGGGRTMPGKCCAFIPSFREIFRIKRQALPYLGLFWGGKDMIRFFFLAPWPRLEGSKHGTITRTPRVAFFYSGTSGFTFRT
jgi:hypothetical protein